MKRRMSTRVPASAQGANGGSNGNGAVLLPPATGTNAANGGKMPLTPSNNRTEGGSTSIRFAGGADKTKQASPKGGANA